jgi:ketosteroid isomerase-like protein
MGNVATSIRAEHVTVARLTLAAISMLDADAALAGLHPELAFELPYEKSVPPLDLGGFTGLLRGLADNFQRFTMTVVEVVECVDPSVLVLRYEGDCLSADGSVVYRNSYVAFLDFDDGLIRRWREYDNPVLSRRMNEQLKAVGTGPRPASGT